MVEYHIYARFFPNRIQRSIKKIVKRDDYGGLSISSRIASKIATKLLPQNSKKLNSVFYMGFHIDAQCSHTSKDFLLKMQFRWNILEHLLHFKVIFFDFNLVFRKE